MAKRFHLADDNEIEKLLLNKDSISIPKRVLQPQLSVFVSFFWKSKLIISVALLYNTKITKPRGKFERNYSEFTKTLAWWNKTFFPLHKGDMNLFTFEIVIFPSGVTLGKYDFSRVNKSSYLPYERERKEILHISLMQGK